MNSRLMFINRPKEGDTLGLFSIVVDLRDVTTRPFSGAVEPKVSRLVLFDRSQDEERVSVYGGRSFPRHYSRCLKRRRRW